MNPNNPINHNDPFDVYDVFLTMIENDMFKVTWHMNNLYPCMIKKPGDRNRVKRERGHTYLVNEKRRNNDYSKTTLATLRLLLNIPKIILGEGIV